MIKLIFYLFTKKGKLEFKKLNLEQTEKYCTYVVGFNFKNCVIFSLLLSTVIFLYLRKQYTFSLIQVLKAHQLSLWWGIIITFTLLFIILYIAIFSIYFLFLFQNVKEKNTYLKQFTLGNWLFFFFFLIVWIRFFDYVWFIILCPNNAFQFNIYI
jgi:hypothetical protein